MLSCYFFIQDKGRLLTYYFSPPFESKAYPSCAALLLFHSCQRRCTALLFCFIRLQGGCILRSYFFSPESRQIYCTLWFPPVASNTDVLPWCVFHPSPRPMYCLGTVSSESNADGTFSESKVDAPSAPPPPPFTFFVWFQGRCSAFLVFVSNKMTRMIWLSRQGKLKDR